MHEKLLSISQVAKLRNLTTETLRHYDRIGLIKPQYVDPETNYRYYSIRQYELIGTVKELRQLGMPLETIVEYFNDRHLEKSKAIFSRYRQEIEEKIAKAVAIRDILEEKLHFLQTLEDLPAMDTIYEQYLPGRDILTFGEKAGGSREHALIFTKLESLLDEVAPIVASSRVGVYGDISLLRPSSEQYIPLIPMIFLENSDLDSPYRKTISAGCFVCICYTNGHLEQYHPCFERVKRYIREHRYTVNGDILQFYRLDVTLTGYPEETVIELQIPVK